MKKLSMIAMAFLLVAGTAMAQSPIGSLNADRLVLQPYATFATNAPATTNNDDSCDIAVVPAATLLVPYFEVDFANNDRATAQDTAFTITNTSAIPQIVHITIWSDWSFPVIDFNIFLTGYDVQGLSLYDILNRGRVPPTSNDTAEGERSADNITGNVNHLGSAAASCEDLPGDIPAGLLADVRAGLTGGNYGDCRRVGNIHSNAIGYITADVAATCSQTLPTEPTYFTNEILFDNVLIGDVLRINPTSTTGNYAGGETAVHIRAIPEGGPVGYFPTNLPYTFYDRYNDNVLTPLADRRQPLPAQFGARYIQGGTGGFNTDLAIWREGTTDAAGCPSPGLSANGAIPLIEIVRFDEQENPVTINPSCEFSPCEDLSFTLAETQAPSSSDTSAFPGDFDGTDDGGGWMYLNLNNNGSPAYSANRQAGGSHDGVSQNWVTVQMTAEGRFGVDFDAAYLANGCSADPDVTEDEFGGPGLPIGPGVAVSAADQSANVTP